MRVSLPLYAEKSMDVKGCITGLTAMHPVVAEQKVLDGRSQWFSHVR